MKIILAATLMLAATTATADWEDIFKNPDLTANYQGYTTTSTVSVDPVIDRVRLLAVTENSYRIYPGSQPDPGIGDPERNSYTASADRGCYFIEHHAAGGGSRT